DTGLGQSSVAEDIEAVLRKIEYWHQGSIATFKMKCRDGKGFWHEVHWDGKSASLSPLGETDEQKARRKLQGLITRDFSPSNHYPNSCLHVEPSSADPRSRWLDEMLESTDLSRVRNVTLRSFCDEWLAGKRLTVSHAAARRYRRALELLLQGVDLRADKPLSC